MSKQELNEKDLQGVAGGANMIYVTPKKESFWQKLLRFFLGKNKSSSTASSSSLEAYHKTGKDIDLNKSPMEAQKVYLEGNNNKNA